MEHIVPFPLSHASILSQAFHNKASSQQIYHTVELCH